MFKICYFRDLSVVINFQSIQQNTVQKIHLNGLKDHLHSTVPIVKVSRVFQTKTLRKFWSSATQNLK